MLGMIVMAHSSTETSWTVNRNFCCELLLLTLTWIHLRRAVMYKIDNIAKIYLRLGL